MVKIWKFPKYLKVTEVILVNCNLAINSYQQNSRVLYTFVNSVNCNSEFSFIETWFID